MLCMPGITELLIHEGYSSVGTEKARDFLTNHVAGNGFGDIGCIYHYLYYWQFVLKVKAGVLMFILHCMLLMRVGRFPVKL